MTKLMVLISVAGAMSASAETTNLIFGTDFEGSGNLQGSFGYAFAGGNPGGAGSGFAGSITGGVGVGGSTAFLAQPDFSFTGVDPNYTNASQYTYSGTDISIQFGFPINPPAATANLDSYILSFDAKVQGLLPGHSTTTVSMNQLNFNVGGVMAVQFVGGNFTVGSNFTHFDVPLSALTINSGTLGNLADPSFMATVDSFVTDFRITEETGTFQLNRSPIWGFDNDNQFIVDNINLNQTSATVAAPIQEKLIWEVNFDDKQPDNYYGFIFRDGANSATVTPTIDPTAGVSGAALRVTADLTSWGTNPPTVFSGFGPGVAKSVPYTLHNTNKNGYRIYMSTKGGGFIPGVVSANGNASIQFMVPPGTLTPSNAADAMVLELSPSVTLSGDYTSFVFDGAATPIGIYNGGSQAMFTQYISKISSIKVQYQFNGGPDIGNDYFGYDADNTAIIDNIKIVELVPSTPPLSVSLVGSQIRISWSDPASGGTAKLQSSTNASGPYLDVAGAASGSASPYTVPSGNPIKFFRTQWVQ